MRISFRQLRLQISRQWLLGGIALASLALVLLYRLGTLTNGMSWNEVQLIQSPLGWSGIYDNPFYMLFKLLQSAIFFVIPDHGQFISRLPNAIYGGLTVLSMAWIISRWHNNRTTLLTILLFATSAWTLHVSRLASLDVVYLSVIPALLFAQLLVQESNSAVARYIAISCRALLLYIPGVIWLVLIHSFIQRQLLKQQIQKLTNWRERLVASLLSIVLIAPLVYHLVTGNASVLKTWLGLPNELAAPLNIVEQFGSVFVHLFVRPPSNPELWLGRVPILDLFSMAMAALGIYFYAKNWRSKRTRTLGVLTLVGAILIALGGPVSLSLLVPMLFIMVATGIAYLLHEWLSVFPRNPLARGVGIGLVSLAVAISCMYNLRSYFVAWPANEATKITFRYHL